MVLAKNAICMQGLLLMGSNAYQIYVKKTKGLFLVELVFSVRSIQNWLVHLLVSQMSVGQIRDL